MRFAVFIMILGMTLIPLGDTASKLLTTTQNAHPFFVAFARFVVGAVLIFPFLKKRDWSVFLHPLVWIRGVLLAAGIGSITISLTTTDLATAFGGLFFAPIVSFFSAILFLKENVTKQQTLLAILGFIGVLCVAQPGENFTQGNLFSLIAGTSYGLFLTASRAVSSFARPVPLIFSQLLIAAIIASPFAIPKSPTDLTSIWFLLAVSGVASMLGNLCLIAAYSHAPATKLAPLVYLQLFAALGLGWLVFHQLPNPFAILGLCVIIIAGIGTAFLKR